MLTTSVTKALIKESGHDTWFGFYGNILQFEVRDEGKIIYVCTDPRGGTKTIETVVKKSIFKKLALAELGLILIEANIPGFKELIRRAKEDKVSGLEDYPLGYIRVDPQTKEVIYKVVMIPRSFIDELAGDNLDEIEKPFSLLKS